HHNSRVRNPADPFVCDTMHTPRWFGETPVARALTTFCQASLHRDSERQVAAAVVAHQPDSPAPICLARQVKCGWHKTRWSKRSPGQAIRLDVHLLKTEPFENLGLECLQRRRNEQDVR